MQIWVTLLTIAGALGGTWLGTWLVGRQAAKDLRANISREIEILAKLRPDSEEAKLLDANIRKNISDLVAQGEQRRRRAQQDTTNVRLFLTFGLIGVALGQMGSWRIRGFWEPLHAVLEGVFWSLLIVYALLLIRVLVIAVSWTKFGARLGWMWGRIGVAKAQTRWGKLRILVLSRLLKAMLSNSEAISAWHEEHDGKEVTPEAIQQREELVARHKRLKRKAERWFRLLRLGSLDKDDDDDEQLPAQADAPADQPNVG
jgi:hypothetical protein